MSDNHKTKYQWPWLLLAAFLFAILLAALWMFREVENVRRIRSSTIGQTSAVSSQRPPAKPEA